MEDKTELGLTLADKIIFIVCAAAIGSAAGFFIKILAGWAAKIPIIPFSSLWEWVSEWDGSWVPITGIVIGVIAGVAFSFYAFHETLHVTVRDENISFRLKEEEDVISASDVGTVYMDKKVLVVLNHDGRELYRGEPEAKRYKIADAFQHHDYPWEEQDPYYNQYQLWVPEHPDFPDNVNALLASRKKALKEDEEKEAETIRKDLTSRGFVVRDEKKQQYVRMAGNESS